jgi:hypothetical protein
MEATQSETITQETEALEASAAVTPAPAPAGETPEPPAQPPAAEPEPLDDEPATPVSLEELRQTSERICPGPSGFVYRVRSLNLQRHAFSGSFPASLQEIAIKQALGESVVRPEDEGQAPSVLIARYADLGDYFDEIVRNVIVEPRLTAPPENEPIKAEIKRLRDLAREADEPGALEPNIEALKEQLAPDPVSFLPPEDYDWAVGLALGTVNTDGKGRPVFGREALATFREGRRE